MNSEEVLETMTKEKRLNEDLRETTYRKGEYRGESSASIGRIRKLVSAGGTESSPHPVSCLKKNRVIGEKRGG